MLDFFNKVCYNDSRELFSISLVLGDIATAEADFASIEDGGLTRGRALDGVGESNRKETNILARARSGALARVFMLFTRALVSPGISFAPWPATVPLCGGGGRSDLVSWRGQRECDHCEDANP